MRTGLHPRSLGEVVSSGLCTGCGMCAALSAGQVEMAVSPQGRMRPRLDRAGRGWPEALALEVCPGARLDGSSLASKRRAGGLEDPVWGHAARLAHGHATDAEVRFRGATAGVLSALSLHLLESGAVDTVLHVESDPDRPLLSRPRRSEDRKGVLLGAASRYGPVAPLTDALALLDEGRTFALVGKPCDVAAVRNLARHDPRVDRQVPYMLTFICEGVPDFASTVGIVEGCAVAVDEVAELSYRGYGWPGPTRVTTRDGRVVEKSYIETWRGDVPYNLQFRCKICPDSIGLQADVVVADAWVSGEPRAELRDGWSCVIARTTRGEELLADAERSGQLFLEPLDFRQLDEMQPQHIRRRRSITARLVGMAAAGAPIPRYADLGLARLWRQNGLRGAWQELAGAFRRVRQGQAHEQLWEETDVEGRTR